MPDLNSVIVESVRLHRARLRLTQAQLGARIGMSGSTISHIEKGTRVVTANDFVPLCQALEIGLGEMLRGASREDLYILGLL